MVERLKKLMNDISGVCDEQITTGNYDSGTLTIMDKVAKAKAILESPNDFDIVICRSEIIEFGMRLTGHDRDTVHQMYQDYENSQ